MAGRVVTVPNALSVLRLVLVPVFAWCLVAEYDLAALAILAVAGATDWLDGWIARRFDQGSALGALLDPAADRLFILVTLLLLAWRDVVPWWLVAVILAREAVLGVMLLVLRRYGHGPPAVHFVGKAATFALLYAFPLLLLAQFGGALGVVAHAVGWAFALWGVALYWYAGAVYLVQAARQVRQQPAVV